MPENLTGIVARARAGDVDAFEQLSRRCRNELMRLAFRILHSRAEAEDVVQDAFVLV